MTCFISDLTSDNHLALSLSFGMSFSLPHIQGQALDASGLFVEDSSNQQFCVYLKTLKHLLLLSRSFQQKYSPRFKITEGLPVYLFIFERGTLSFNIQHRQLLRRIKDDEVRPPIPHQTQQFKFDIICKYGIERWLRGDDRKWLNSSISVLG